MGWRDLVAVDPSRLAWDKFAASGAMPGGVRFVHASDELKALIERSDTIVNLAAICNPSEYIKQPVNTINSNFTDAQDCIKYCVELDKHLIHFSTCEIYGRTLSSYGLPADEPKNYLLDEETTPMIMGPVSAQRWCYACAKQLVERLIYAHGTENNLKFTIVRPYNWIGPRMDYIPGVDGSDDGQPRVPSEAAIIPAGSLWLLAALLQPRHLRTISACAGLPAERKARREVFLVATKAGT